LTERSEDIFILFVHPNKCLSLAEDIIHITRADEGGMPGAEVIHTIAESTELVLENHACGYVRDGRETGVLG
jgi:hypothetical protein